MSHDQLNAITVVLHRPQEAANVGAVVRAMKNMGVADLRLVQPEPFENTDILRVAHRCEDILAQMTIHSTLTNALADTVYVLGTAAIDHHQRPQTEDIRPLARDVINRAREGRVALLFGQEDNGLDNDALDQCHLIVTLPSNPAYPALNLAQAVLLLLYEVRMAVLTVQPDASILAASAEEPATQAELERLFQLSEETLTAIDFFRYNPARAMRKLRQIAYRARLSGAEAKLLMAILRKLIRYYAQP